MPPAKRRWNSAEMFRRNKETDCFASKDNTNNTIDPPCPQGYVSFARNGTARCHNLIIGTQSYEKAEQICRSRGGEFSTITEEDELILLRDEAKNRGLNGNVMLKKEDGRNDTCIFFEIEDDDNAIVETDCDSEEVQNISTFACMVLECVVTEDGRACKMVECQTGEVSYYRKSGRLTCHKIINKAATWEDAQKQCRQLGEGHQLGSFEDKKEAEYVMGEARRIFGCKKEACYGTLWIGGKRKSRSPFTWIFDKTLAAIGPYNNFDEGEPDGDRRSKTEECLAIYINEATYLDQHCFDDVKIRKESYYAIRGFVCTAVKIVKREFY
ncbi:unnamed protein product [Cylicocyclus nassatus]|uniref:C-type lectin domain-containing protein n=1 Tax=Cylicocyclus nassatus TaxID=53992 RepID=A0AA36H8S2_CYLNA|nr:unnamed protein product [Cylicocyclus nassatus]